MKNSAILVTGAGGYIGSHMADLLKVEGRDVIVLDDFSTGFRDAIPGLKIYKKIPLPQLFILPLPFPFASRSWHHQNTTRIT